MTDHEKLRFHSRPSSEFLAAVPIKKRRFILPPSPPHESPTPILADCSTPEKKPESSELEPLCLKTGGNPAEVNIVSGEVARESHDPALRTAGCALTEKKPKSSVPASPFSETVGTPVQVSLATGKGSSEPGELPSPAQTDGCLPEKKTASPFSRNGGNPVQVNAVTGNNASCEHREWQATAAGCGISEKKPESSELGSLFSNCGLNPAEVSAVTGQNASCEPCMIPSPTQADGISEKKPEPTKPVCPFPKTGGNVGAQVNSVTGKDSYHESRRVPMTRDLNICPKPEFLTTSNDQGSGLNLATNSQDGTDKVQEMILNGKCAAWLVNGGNPVQVNAVTGNNVSCEHRELQATAAGCDISEKKPESLEPGSPFSKCGLNPAEMSAVTGQNASCEPCMIPSPTQADGISEKKPEPSKPLCPFPETGGNPVVQVNSVTGIDYSHESRKVPITRDLNICPKPEFLLTPNDQGSGLNLATNSQDGTDKVQEMILNGICAAWLISGSVVTPSAAKQTSVMPGMGGNGEGKLTPSKGIFVKQEVSETTSSDTKLKTDSSRLSPNRSNWDLNTTMDAWGGSSADSLLNNAAADSGRKDLGGIQKKRFEVGPKQILFKEPNGTDVTLKNYELQKKLKNPMEPNSVACLDLQLKPSFLPKPCITSGNHDASKEMPFLTLGMKPMLSTGSQPLATGRTVKSEPIESDQKDAGQVQSGVLKSPDLKHVKTEPCEGQQISKMTIPDNMNLACSRAIKPEPLENQSLRCVRNPEGSSFHVGLKSHRPDLQSTLMHQNACEDDNKGSDAASKPPDSSNVLHTCTDKSNTNISNDSSDTIDKDRDLVNQASILGNDEVTTAIAQYLNGIATEPSALGSESLVSDGNDMNSLPVACELSSLPEASLSDPLASNVEGVSAEGAAELVVEMDASNTGHLPHVSLIDEVLRKPCGNSRIVEPDEVEGKAGVSSEAIDEPCDSTCRSGGSHAAARTVNSVHRQCGKADDDYEDGEVRYPELNGAVEGSCVVTEGRGVKAANSIIPVDVPVSMAKVDSSNEGNALSSKEGDGRVLENKVEPSSALGALSADSGKRSLSKTIRRAPKDLSKNDTDPERKSKSRNLSSKTSTPDCQSGAASGEQQNTGGPIIAKKYVSSKAEPAEKVSATRDAKDRGNRRIIYLNSASNCSESGKRKSTSDRLMSSRGEGERDVDRSFRRERSHSRGSRDEYSNERSWKVESQRHYGHPVEKRRSDFMRIQSRADRLNALHGDRNANPEHLLEQINSSNGIRYSRPISAAEVAIGASPDVSNRLTRKLTNEEMQNPSRFPCQRRSPGGRVQIPLGRHSIRDISPSRCIGRDVPDFALLAHEEKLLRNFPEDMAEHSMLSHSHPRAQYERAEGIILHRERRSLSPPLRRGGPLQIPPNCQKSSPRSQQRPTHQWSPPRRTSDSFSGQRDLGRCRSPPIMRINRMQSPHDQPCFPEEVIVRRRGSPPYIARLPADMVDVGPTREHNFPRLVRGPNRNMRRFNMIDPREMMEDEYFDPPLVHSQIREFDVGDEFVEERRCDERRGPIRPFRQRCVAGDNEGESFRFHDENGPPRGLRLHSDAIEGFPEDGGPRDFDVHFRNRLGNPSGRLRGQEQEDNYRHHGEQEWRDTAFNDGRPKRRRF